MESDKFSGDEKIEFRQIVLEQLKNILEISKHQLRDGSYVVSQRNLTDTKYQEDTRYSYIQAIENLAYVLMPFFDAEMHEVYNQCLRIINAFGYELKIILKKTYEKIEEGLGSDKIPLNAFAIEMKLRYAKKLFIALNMLLKRNDYLQSSVFGENVMTDEIVEGDDINLKGGQE
jgi:hypothetical protein